MRLTDQIIFIDGEALVLDKPAGLAVEAPRDGALSVEHHLELLKMGFQRRPGIVHRLDRDTSGCLLLARNPKAHKQFSAAFETGQVDKVYLALLAGIPTAQEGAIDLPLAKVSSREAGWRMVVDEARGKAALTRWRLLTVKQGRALVEFRPATGRTHQLRVHAESGLGLPIVGDAVYGVGDEPLKLHAWQLTVPRGDKPPVVAVAPLPDWAQHD
jgi:tRNA pseudouridine32 synthase / 23S rRNA pseudouridine746 synthase